jgi:hypothetical protein
VIHAAVTAVVLLAAAAQTAADGPEGQTLTVSRATGLSPAGETVTVEGTGYDENKGIYVAFCVDNGPGAMPSPCGGGADTTGSLGASHWISSNPPSYGESLAVPYGDGGSFSVTLNVTPQIEDVDCTIRACAVVTRADHTRSGDRTQDVRIPVSFGGEPEPEATTTTEEVPEAVVVTAGPVPTGAATPVADALEVTRVSSSDTAGRWWLAAAGGLVLLLAALVVVRRRAAR